MVKSLRCLRNILYIVQFDFDDLFGRMNIEKYTTNTFTNNDLSQTHGVNSPDMTKPR